MLSFRDWVLNEDWPEDPWETFRKKTGRPTPRKTYDPSSPFDVALRDSEEKEEEINEIKKRIRLLDDKLRALRGSSRYILKAKIEAELEDLYKELEKLTRRDR